jgi:hypothetical protein
MATHFPSSPIVSQGSTIRPQADLLPTKRGEIGYRESLNPTVPSDAEPESNVTAHRTSAPARHPTDRVPRPARSEPGSFPIANTNGNQSVAGSQPSSRPILAFFEPKYCKFGVRVSTILFLVTQGSLLLATIALWVILATLILPPSVAGRKVATSVFVHITFVICTIAEVVLFERILFRYRAERYAILHAGEALPDSFNRRAHISTRLALAPWNRPPLPTYAAVLMESGVGTGDVEDNRIAVSPPPAYGYTRGSTLLLAGFISDELQEQSQLAREAREERSSQATVASIDSNKSIKSRPTSYVTVDSEWDARCDMNRATYLAETLAQLEAEEVDSTVVQVVSPLLTQTGFMNPGPSPKSPPPSSP